MSSFLRRFFGGGGSSNGGGGAFSQSNRPGFGRDRHSKSLAKSRLSFVLVQDRTGLTQDEISAFKKEMVAVIEKYFVIDETGLDVSYKRETDSTMLIINSPVVVKRQDAMKHLVGAKHRNSADKTPVNKTVDQAETSKPPAESAGGPLADGASTPDVAAAKAVGQ